MSEPEGFREYVAERQGSLLGTAWLLTGSVALLLVALGVMTRTLADYKRHAAIYRPLALVMAAAAAVALLVGWLQPAALLLALLLAAILATVWLFAVVRLFRTGTWDGPDPVAAARAHGPDGSGS